MPKLIAQSGHSFNLPNVGVTFGSDSTNDVMIPPQFGLAPIHFAIWPEAGVYRLRDTGSGYGVWINGKPVKEAHLSHADVISAGNLQLEFFLEESERPKQSQPLPTPPLGKRTIRLPRLRTTKHLNKTAAAVPVPAEAPADAPNSTPPVSAPAHDAPPPTERAPDLLGAVPERAKKPESGALPQFPVVAETNRSTSPIKRMTTKGLAKSTKNLPTPPVAAPSSPVQPPPPVPPHQAGALAGDALPQRTPAAQLFEMPTPWESSDEKPAKPTGLPKIEPENLPKRPWDLTKDAETTTAHGAVVGNVEPIRLPKRKDGHSRPKPWGTLVLVVLLGAFTIGVATARHWCAPLAEKMEGLLAYIFTDPPPKRAVEAGLVEPQSPEKPDPQLAPVDAVVKVEETKAHIDIAPRFMWKDAATLFSLGFPEIEIFYLNASHRKDVPLPKPHCTYLEKNFGIVLQDLLRLTSIQQDPNKTGISVVTTRHPVVPERLLEIANIPVETPETVGKHRIWRWNFQGDQCGLVQMDERNIAIGDPSILAECLENPPSINTVNSLWPEFLRKTPGCFLWTVKADKDLQNQLRARSTEPLDLSAVQGFAVRFGVEKETETKCFAMRSDKSSPEMFAAAANSLLRSMVDMISEQIESSTRKTTIGKPPPIEVSRYVASADLARGQEFVSLFLEGFYAPPTGDISPLKLIEKARVLAHNFNLAKSFGAGKAQGVSSVGEALEALQTGMTGAGKASGMEFQAPPMAPEESRQVRQYLTFADGYMACRPDWESLSESAKPLVQEAYHRMNAETVLSIVPSPSRDKVVKLKDLGEYIRSHLAKLKAAGPKDLFALPQLNDTELAGILHFIHQDNRGQLAWKPGEISYKQWLQQSNPAALRDAATIASIFNAAKAAGAIKPSDVKDVHRAIEILTEGVKGSGQFSNTLFRCQALTQEEAQAAAGLLSLEEGNLKVRSSGQ